MSLFKVFDVAGSAMNAQSVRMNVTASNLANAGSIHGDPAKVYRTRYPIFSAFRDALNAPDGVSGVRLDRVVESRGPLLEQHRPDHPDANEDGNVYVSDVSTIDEMVNMMSASRSYQNSIELINTSKDLLLQTLALGR